MAKRDIHILADQIIKSVTDLCEHDDAGRQRLYVMGFLAGHLATILHTDPRLRREFYEKIEQQKAKGPAAKS